MDIDTNIETPTLQWQAVVDGPPPPPARDEYSLFGLTELFLRDHRRIDTLIRQAGREFTVVPRFLAIALAAYCLHGAAMAALLDASALPLPRVPPAHWSDGSALSLILAYALGMIAACGVCLPSFYFYGLLSGIKPTMLQTTLFALKCQAATGIMLVAVLPIYIALALGLVVFEAPRAWCEHGLYLGLFLKDEGRLDEAQEHLKRAGRLRSQDLAVLYLLGSLHLAAGRAAEARQALEVVVTRAPSYRQAHVLLATACYRLKDQEQGDRHRDIAEKLRAEQQAREPGPVDELAPAFQAGEPAARPR